MTSSKIKCVARSKRSHLAARCGARTRDPEIKSLVFIDVLLQTPLVASSIPLKKFLDPAGYDFSLEEEALRQTSMLLRAEPHWKMIEPLKRIGSRIRREFFLVNCETEVVSKQALSWVSVGSE
eukprot:sb/3475827/